MIRGTHPLILKYNDLIEQANIIKKQFMAIRKEHPVPKAMYRIERVCQSEVDTISFILALDNGDELKNYTMLWGIKLRIVPEIYSREYQRIPGYIKCIGLGHKFLKGQGTSFRVISCTDEEWESIKTGNIPEKLRPNWYVQR